MKISLRKEILQARKNIPIDEKLMQESFVCNTLISRIDHIKNNKIAVYQACNSELSLKNFISNFPKQQIYFPAMVEDKTFFYEFIDGAPYILEPFKKFKKEELTNFKRINYDKLTHIIVPLVAFDDKNNRLGYGGGVYDRILPQLNKDCKIFGVGFWQQKVEKIPVEKHDIKLQQIIYFNKTKSSK